MKIKRLSSLMLLTALAWLVPKQATAAEYIVNAPVHVWTQNAETPSQYLQMAATDKKVYTFPAHVSGGDDMLATYYTRGYLIENGNYTHWSCGGSNSTFPFAKNTGSTYYYYAGPACATDDEGTLFAKSVRATNGPGGLVYSEAAGGVTAWVQRATSATEGGEKLGIDFSGSYKISARSDMMSANGQCINGTGYLWFIPNGTTYLERVTITKGTPAKTLSQFNSPKSNPARSYVKEYATGKLLYNPGSNGGTDYLYRGTYSSGSTSVTWEKLNLIVYRHGSTAFVIGGHEVIAYSSSTTQVTLYDYTAQTEIGKITPFSTVSSNGYISHSMDAKVSGNTAELYIYVPGQGAAKYTITATEIVKTGAKVTKLGYSREYKKDGDYQLNTLTWTAPTGMVGTTVTGYNIYVGDTKIGTAAASATSYADSRYITAETTYTVVPLFDGLSEDKAAYGASITVPVVEKQGAAITNLKGSIAWDAETSTQTNTLTWTAPAEDALFNTSLTGYKIYVGDEVVAEVDASLTSYSFAGVTAKTTYTVIPQFTGIEEKPVYGASVTLNKISPIAPAINHVATFDGYNNVQVYWNAPSTAQRATYYEVWRDGIKISDRKIVAYCHIETEVVEGDHYYEIKGVYTVDGTIDGEVAVVMTSAPYNFSVTARNMTYTKYALEEVYNYLIPQEGETATADMINNTLCPDFYDQNNYRQGAYYDGYWYIVQRAASAHYNTGGWQKGDIDYESDKEVADNHGTIYRVSATDPRSGWEQLISLDLNSTVGIAIDKAGNIFVRKDNWDALSATQPSDATTKPIPTWLEDHFSRRLTTGLIYKRNANGTYDTANPVTVDLTGIYANSFVDQLPDGLISASDELYEHTRGRVDYYSLSGDIMSAEGGYLYLSYYESTYASRVKIANGAYVSHEHYNVAEYQDWSGNISTLNPLGTIEGYAFPVDGRDDVVVQLRSQVIAQVLDEHFKGTTTETPLAIQRMVSRVNTAGGTTIAFNNDLFMISPQTRYSRNLGDFIVMRANKTDVTDINTADLHWTIPVWQVEQDEISSSEKTNANGNWYFAEESTWTVDNQEVPCVYIYQYIPGIRIAKYRLYPLTQFPNPEAQFDIVTGYQCDDNGTPIDITCFDGHVTWQKPAEYNYVEGQSTYRLDSYHLDILDAAGTVIDHAIVAHNDNQLVFAYDYAGTELLDDKANYIARIHATYTDINGKEYISDRYNALDNHEYIPAPPVVENVNAYIHSGLWDKDVYRVELNFAKPTETTEPVSYYSVYAKMPTGETVQINDFNLMVDGVENENIVDGVALLWDSIPGTYDFDANEAAWHAGLPEASEKVSTLVWYHTVEMGHYTHSSSMARATANDPSTWTYYVVANYASTNAKLATAEEASKTTDSDLIITGVEAVSAEVTGMLKVFPNPAHSVVNIQSAVAIETVALYNEAGAEALNVAGNGENAMQLDVESLADGVYFLRVNNLPPVKIVKN